MQGGYFHMAITDSMNDNLRLQEAINELSQLPDTLKVSIHGKKYATVKERNRIFRKYFGADAYYISRVEFRDPIFHDNKMIFAGSVVATTELWIKKNILAVGIAEEIRNSSPVNKTSATENAMTSSLGICLARAGLDGGEFASADEMQTVTRNRQAVDELENNFMRDTSKGDIQKENIIPSKGVFESPLEVSIKSAKHQGDLQEIFTKHKDEIMNNNSLQDLYMKKDASVKSNKPSSKEDFF